MTANVGKIDLNHLYQCLMHFNDLSIWDVVYLRAGLLATLSLLIFVFNKIGCIIDIS